MEEKVREAIRELFENAPESQEVRELQEEMISNAEEKYQDLIQRGFTEEQAYTMVQASIGDVQELLEVLGAQAQQGEEGAETKKSEYWEKQYEYWRWQSEYWEKQARNLGDQAKTQARNLGHQAKSALNTVLESGIAEEIANSVKQIIGSVGINLQADNGEYTDMKLWGERKFSTDGIASLIVELQSSPVDLDVQLTTDSEILVQEYYNKEPQKGQTLEFTLSGNQLKFHYGMNVIGIPRRGIVRIFLPEKFAGEFAELCILTASGDVTLEDIGAVTQVIRTASGDVKGKGVIGKLTVQTTSGNVEFDRIDGASHAIKTVSGDVRVKEMVGDLTVQTASGDIFIGKMQGKVIQNSASGDVEIKELEGDGTFHTASGDIELNVIKAGEKLEFGTGSGDVKATLPAQTGVQMTLNTGSGDINTFCDGMPQDQEHADYVKHGKHVVGRIGEEPFLQLLVNTGSGDIDIRR